MRNPGLKPYSSSQFLIAMTILLLVLSFPKMERYMINSFSRLASDLLKSSSGRNKLILQKILPSNFLTVAELDYGCADFIISCEPK